MRAEAAEQTSLPAVASAAERGHEITLPYRPACQTPSGLFKSSSIEL